MNMDGSALRRMLANENNRGLLATALALLGIVVVLSIIAPNFATASNISNVLVQASTIFVLGVGMTLVITTAGIDISIGSIVGLTASTFGAVVIGLELNPVLGVGGALLVGAVCGLANGAVIIYLRVPPIITTIATMVIFRGLALVLLEGTIHFNYPDSVRWIARGEIAFVPVPIVISAIVLVLGIYFLKYTNAGRYMTAIGGNAEAARLAGINVGLYTALAYVIMGTLSGLAAIILVARLNAAQATLGANLEIHTIAAVVIGGTYLFGGRGTMVGTALGVVIIGLVENGLVLAGVSAFWQRVVLGIVLIAAVAIRTYRARR